MRIGRDFGYGPGEDAARPPGRPAVRRIRKALHRNLYTIAFVVPFSLFLGILATMLMTRRYQAEASVQIAAPSRPVVRSAAEPGNGADTQRALRTQLEILRSRALRLRVAQDLGLLRGDEFLVRMHAPTSIGADAERIRADRVLGVLKNNLDIDLAHDSAIARIRFTSPDPVLAARIANGFARSYILFDLQRRYETSAYYRRFLDAPLAQARQRLEDAQRAVASARGSAGDGERADPDRADSAYADARAKRIAAQRRWDAVRNADPMTLRGVIEDRGIQRLFERRADARSDYRRQQRKPNADPARLRREAARVAALDESIAAAIDAVKRPIRDAYDTALRHERTLAEARDAARRAAAADAIREARLRQLRPDVDAARALYDGLLARYKAIGDAVSLGESGLAVVDTAVPPQHPVSPRRFVNLAIALALGLAVTAIAIVTRETLDDLIRSPDDVKETLGLDTLAVIPRPSGVRPIADALADRRSRISEAYHTLRRSLEVSGPAGTPRSLVFIACRPASGASTSALAVARDFARSGRRVLLVDADLHGGGLHTPFGAGNMVGLSNLLSRNAEADEALQPTDDPNLTLIASGPPPPNPTSLLAGPLLRSILEAMRDRFDLVVVDGPPASADDDADLIADAVEGVVLVAQVGGCRTKRAVAAVTHLSAARARIIGVALTKANGELGGPGQSGRRTG